MIRLRASLDSWLAAVVAATAITATLTSCGGDPVHDSEVAALGGERGSPGPTHRPGQPCLTCHGGSGPAAAQFSVAGTAYKVKGQPDPLVGATVSMTDVRGSKRALKTNSVGNFYVLLDNWAPANPIHNVVLSFPNPGNMPDPYAISMLTLVGRDGSCAGCHFDPVGPATPGSIYLVEVASDFPGAQP